MKTHSGHTLALSCTGQPSSRSKAVQLLTMIMHFHSAVTESPGAIFTEISQWRWCYVTAAMDPAVHITNASHCGGVTCFIQATSRRQQQQCSSCYYSPAPVTQDHAEPCSSHTAASSTEQPCSSPRHSSFHRGLETTFHTTNAAQLTHRAKHMQETLMHSRKGSAIINKPSNTYFIPHFQLCQWRLRSSGTHLL